MLLCCQFENKLYNNRPVIFEAMTNTEKHRNPMHIKYFPV